MKVNWATSAPVPWRSTTPRRRAPSTSVGASTTSAAGHRPHDRDGAEPAVRPARADDHHRPVPVAAGTESAWAYAHLPRGRRSPDVVAASAATIEAEVERHAPGFRDSWWPAPCRSADLEAADPSLVGGALNGGTAALHQQLVFRPTPGLGGPDTPFAGLYLAGSSAHPGGGVHGACGANAARAALLRAQSGPGSTTTPSARPSGTSADVGTSNSGVALDVPTQAVERLRQPFGPDGVHQSVVHPRTRSRRRFLVHLDQGASPCGCRVSCTVASRRASPAPASAASGPRRTRAPRSRPAG